MDQNNNQNKVKRAFAIMSDLFPGTAYNNPFQKLRDLQKKWNPTQAKDFDDAIALIDEVKEQVENASNVASLKDVFHEEDKLQILSVLDQLSINMMDEKSNFLKSQKIGTHHSIGDDLPPELL